MLRRLAPAGCLGPPPARITYMVILFSSEAQAEPLRAALWASGLPRAVKPARRSLVTSVQADEAEAQRRAVVAREAQHAPTLSACWPLCRPK